MKTIRDYLILLLGSFLYAAATVCLVFPNSFSFGGTSGIGLILSGLVPISASTLTAMLNVILMVLAFVILGRQFAVRTFAGSAATTFFIWLLGKIPPLTALHTGFIPADLVIAVLIIALASALMFTVNGSSGGTDIVAMILSFKKPGLPVGRALVITDCIIVLATAFIMGWRAGLTSLIGLIIKGTLIDVLMKYLKKRLPNNIQEVDS